MIGFCENCPDKNAELFEHVIPITGITPSTILGESRWRVCGSCKKRLDDMRGYSGTSPGTLAGKVHRAEFIALCSCGGRVHAYDNGEVITHSLPLDTTVEHRAGYPHKQQLLFDYKLVE